MSLSLSDGRANCQGGTPPSPEQWLDGQPHTLKQNQDGLGNGWMASGSFFTYKIKIWIANYETCLI